MATSSGRSGGSPRGTILERILRSSTSAGLVGAMVHEKIIIPEDDYNGAPIRLQLARSIKMPLDDESRNLIATFVMHWLDVTNPTNVRPEAANPATVKPQAIALINALTTVNTNNALRATVKAKKESAERKLDEMIGRTPGRPTNDSNPIIEAVMGQDAGGGGNSLISALLVLNELGESNPLPIHFGPRRTEPIERRREWAESAAKTVAGIALFAVLVASFVLGAMTHWAIGLVFGIALIVGLVWAVISAVKAGGGWLMKKAFPQFDEEGFREKVSKQCEITLAYTGLTKAEVVAMGLEHKFLEEVDGELRKEGLVYTRYDEQIDDWVKDYLGLATTRPVTPKASWIDRLAQFLEEHNW